MTAFLVNRFSPRGASGKPVVFQCPNSNTTLLVCTGAGTLGWTDKDCNLARHKPDLPACDSWTSHEHTKVKYLPFPSWSLPPPGTKCIWARKANCYWCYKLQMLNLWFLKCRDGQSVSRFDRGSEQMFAIGLKIVLGHMTNRFHPPVRLRCLIVLSWLCCISQQVIINIHVGGGGRLQPYKAWNGKGPVGRGALT